MKGHTLNIDLADGSCETPLSLALWTGQFEIGLKLLDAGADIECKEQMANGMTLLYQSIVREKPNAALFLLNNGADYKKRFYFIHNPIYSCVQFPYIPSFLTQDVSK